MADSITIKVSDLYDRVKQMKDNNMDYVELSILDEQEFDSEIIPTTLWLSAISKEDTSISVDYDEIEEVETE